MNARICTSCRIVMPANARFCPHCGTAVVSELPKESPSTKSPAPLPVPPPLPAREPKRAHTSAPTQAGDQHQPTTPDAASSLLGCLPLIAGTLVAIGILVLFGGLYTETFDLSSIGLRDGHLNLPSSKQELNWPGIKAAVFVAVATTLAVSKLSSAIRRRK